MSQRNLDSTYPKGATRPEGPTIDRRDSLSVPNPPRGADQHEPFNAPRMTPRNDAVGGSGGSGGVKLDKRLDTIRVDGRPGPDKTPGGHGQVWGK